MSSGARRALVVVLSGLLFLRGGVAHAGATEVSLSIAGCEQAELSTERLQDLVRIEIAPAELVTDDPAASRDVRGAIELCHQGSPELVEIVLRDRRHALGRTVDLSDVRRELRERTLAVVFGELLSELPLDAADAAPASSAPTAAPPARQPAAEPPRPERPAPQRARAEPLRQPRRSRFVLGAGANLRQFALPATTLAGPWLSLGLGAWRVEALLLHASHRALAGTVGVYELGLGAVWAPLELGASPRLLLGLRGEVGISWAVGSPSANSRALGSTKQAEQLALLVEPRLELPLSPAVSLEARLSAGAARGPIATQDGVPRATSRGPFVGAALGVQASF